MAQLIHDFIFESATRTPQAAALSVRGKTLDYATLAGAAQAAAAALLTLGVGAGERVAVFLDKRVETVALLFGAAAAGAVFVPINPLLKAQQVAHILSDCGARVLLTSRERLLSLTPSLPICTDLHAVLLTEAGEAMPDLPGLPSLYCASWEACLAEGASYRAHRRIDGDMAAILYTSGSTGKPKGVVLSHRNLVAGALSVSSYLRNDASDRILCLLPLSFDYGLNQLTTAFATGACAVLINHLLLRDVLTALEDEAITGLAAVPPLWIQLAALRWPALPHLRYITNSGGAMHRTTLARLRAHLPHVQVYLMYGLTEAFRSTYLAPVELDRRPDSIGKAIPNAEVMVLRPDGTPCAPGEPGELVHRGALVSLGYWNDPQRTAERFRPITAEAGLPLSELAVWSGDTVRTDEEGFLYFVGRNDEMIKTLGYRVSPGEIEEVVYASGLVAETVALGLRHPVMGQAIALLATPINGAALEQAQLAALCKTTLPGFMQPAWIEIRQQPLPRNPNGKIDRASLVLELNGKLAEPTA